MPTTEIQVIKAGQAFLTKTHAANYLDLSERQIDRMAAAGLDDGIPVGYRDHERPGGEPLTAEYVSRSETYGISESTLTRLAQESQVHRIKRGRKYLYRYKDIAAESGKANREK